MASSSTGASSGTGSSGVDVSLSLTRYHLAKENELRFEVGEDESAGFGVVKLVSGNAEIFGVELVEGKPYQFPPGRKLAVFTWYGAELHLSGNITNVYTATDAPMALYATLHQRLEARREEARILGLHGPRVFVVGPTDSGKSTLCRILAAYAARVGRCTTFIDTDIGQGELSVPGSVAALTVDRSSLSVEAEGFATAAPGSIAPGASAPLVYFFGHVTPGESGEHFRNTLTRLADTVTRRLSTDDTARVGGCIVNSMGYIDGVGYEILLETVRVLAIDVVVVQGNDRLFARLSEDLKGLRLPVKPAAAGGGAAPESGGDGAASGDSSSASSSSAASAGSEAASKSITVIKLPRSGGVVERARTHRKDARKARLREYFYGPYRGPGTPPLLSPVAISVSWDDVTIVRVGGMTVCA
jgi:polyribonucleotide 5'-hydroxyl-kinase